MSMSALWLCFSAYMFITQEHPAHLNEWGDFFAGFFSPLAFLWLVLGYLQQGEELRNSSVALRLQADELKNSVEQQSQLVQVSRLQLEQEMKALEDERQLRRGAALPKFIPQSGNKINSGGNSEYKFSIMNIGRAATNVRISFSPGTSEFTQNERAVFQNNESITMGYAKIHSNTTVSVTYMDSDGQPGAVEFMIDAINGQLNLSEVRRIA